MSEEQFKSEWLDEFVESGDIKEYIFKTVYDVNNQDVCLTSSRQILELTFHSGKVLVLRTGCIPEDNESYLNFE